MSNLLCNKSILIVDDDVRLLRALGKVLSDEGAATTCVEWADDAFRILTARPKKFDLVITDFRMPFVSGLQVMQTLREILPKLPIMVLTAYGGPDVQSECMRQGAAAFLEKPVDADQLLATISNLFTSRTNG